MRGFGAGILWGGVVAVVGLGVVSLLTPLPAGQKPVAAANETAAPAAEAAPPAAAEPPAKPATTAPAAVPEPQAPPAATPDASEPAPPEAETPEAETEIAPPVQTPPEAPPAAPTAAPSEIAKPATLPTNTAPATDAEPAAPPVVPAPTQPAAGASADAAPAASPEPAPELAPAATPSGETAEADLAPLPGEVPSHSPLAPAPEPDQAEAAPVEPAAPSEPLLDRPEPGLDGIKVEGVTTDRLPRIEEPADPAADAAIQADPRPVARFAAKFENPQNKPRYAILLIDDGKAQIDRAALATIPLPVTLVLDPAAPEAAKLEAMYRKAGKEVAMLATQIPKGAAPSDLAVTFAAHAKTLPQAVAVVDLPKGGFQDSRQMASDLVPVIKDQGRGLVTFDKGLNAGDQVARREAVPAALIFRELDGAGEDGTGMRRHLDRAAFKAAQDGRVAVLGHATPDTIAALLEWSVEGRAGSVALAPLTAVLATPE